MSNGKVIGVYPTQTLKKVKQTFEIMDIPPQKKTKIFCWLVISQLTSPRNYAPCHGFASEKLPAPPSSVLRLRCVNIAATAQAA